MNRYDFTQPGGFPLDQGVMKFIQDCINTAAQSAALAGPLAILSGCVPAGGSVSDGWVVINGEILPFSGGITQAKVVISQDIAPVIYQDGTPRAVKFTRAARFGDDGGVTNYVFANFKRNTTEGILARLDRVEGLLRPFNGAGGMVWWQGTVNTIPAGWREVVSWRGRFPMHYNPTDADFDAIGETGGEKTHTLTIAEMPSHGHEFEKIQTQGSGTISGYVRGAVQGTDSKRTENEGGGQAHSILNPYKVGCWIEPIPGTF